MEANLQRESAHGSIYFQLGDTMKRVSVARWIRMGLVSTIFVVLGFIYISLLTGGDMVSSLLSFERGLILFGFIILGIDLGTQINLSIKELRTSREFVQLSQLPQFSQRFQPSRPLHSFQQSPQPQQYQQSNHMGSQGEEFSKMAKFFKIGAILELVEHGIIALIGILFVSLIHIDIISGYGALIFVILVLILVFILELVGKLMHLLTWVKFSSWFDSAGIGIQHRENEFQGAKPTTDMLKIGYIVHAGGYVAILGFYYIAWLIIIIGNIMFTSSLAKMGTYFQSSGQILAGEEKFYSTPQATRAPQGHSMSRPQQIPAPNNTGMDMDMGTGMSKGTGMSMKERFCSFCGASFGGDNLRFCPNCGHVIQD
ncbi:MAG: hypothetical protein ACTSYI_16020 [Promethearchaeota archaeon]